MNADKAQKNPDLFRLLWGSKHSLNDNLLENMSALVPEFERFTGENLNYKSCIMDVKKGGWKIPAGGLIRI